MGAGNVVRVITVWSKLDPVPKLALIQMAVTALDRQEPGVRPRFYGGWTLLAIAIGQDVPDGCERCRGCKACRPPRRAVERAVAGLLAARAVTQTRRASRGRTAEYALWLDGPAPVETARQIGLNLGPQPP